MRLLNIGRARHFKYKDDINSLLNLLSKNKNKISYDTEYYAHERCNCFGIGLLDESADKIVGIGYLYVLHKPHGKKVGQIEDIIIRESFRGLGFASSIVEQLKQMAIEHGCYKIILNCDEKLETFYKQLGFKQTNIQMAIYNEL